MRRKYFQIAIFILGMIGLIVFSLLALPVVAVETITLNPIADSHVESDEPTTNYGAGLNLWVRFSDYTVMDDVRFNAYLLFDLTTLDTELFDINSATLEAYTDMGSSPTAQVGVHLCQDTDWNEIEITWENAPSFSSEPIDVTAVAFGDTYYSWDVTNEVKNTQEGYLTLVLTVESVGDSYQIDFSSKDFYRDIPRLVIDYEATTQEPPVASFTYSPLDPQVNDTVTFDASGSSDIDGTIVSYMWDFGDGDTSTSQNPTHAYTQEGSYSVTLTVTDNDGLMDTTTVSIAEVVIPEFSSYVLLLVSLTVVAVALAIYKRKLNLPMTP